MPKIIYKSLVWCPSLFVVVQYPNRTRQYLLFLFHRKFILRWKCVPLLSYRIWRMKMNYTNDLRIFRSKSKGYKMTYKTFSTMWGWLNIKLASFYVTRLATEPWYWIVTETIKSCFMCSIQTTQNRIHFSLMLPFPKA